MATFQAIWHSKVVLGALYGALGAAAADYHAFLTWKGVSDVKAYDWGTAAFRWLQGAVVGGVGAAGVGLVS